MTTARGWFTATAVAVVATALTGTVSVLAGDAPAEPDASALGDLVRASGDNVLTVVVGIVAVIGIYFGRRMGRREIALLVGGAIALTFVAIVISHVGTQEALDFEEAKAQTDADLRVTALQQDHEQAIQTIQNDHAAEIRSLDNRLSATRIQALAAIALNDSLDDCLDTIHTIGGMAQAFRATGDRDNQGALVILVSLGQRIGLLVDETMCARPDVELGDIAISGGG